MPPYLTPNRILEDLGLDVRFVDDFGSVPDREDREPGVVYVRGPLRTGLPFVGHDVRAIRAMSDATIGKWTAESHTFECIGTEEEVMGHVAKHVRAAS